MPIFSAYLITRVVLRCNTFGISTFGGLQTCDSRHENKAAFRRPVVRQERTFIATRSLALFEPAYEPVRDSEPEPCCTLRRSRAGVFLCSVPGTGAPS